MDTLIIGGSRFTGPELIDRLCAAGSNVTVFNRGNHDLSTEADVDTVVGDRRDEEALASVFETRSFDAIVDTCAYKPEDVGPLLQSNCSPDQYICYSTAGVYSHTCVVPFRETDERGGSRFWGEYGASKAALENRLFRAHEKTGFPVTVLRFPYIYGPGNHLYREVALFDHVQSERPVPIPADGQTLLQFVFVADVVKAVETVVESDSAESTGEAYNVAEPRSYTYQRLVNIVSELTDTHVQTVRFNPPEKATDVFELIPFGSRHLYMDVSKWRQFSDWEFTTIHDGMAETLEWYETANPEYEGDLLF